MWGRRRRRTGSSPSGPRTRSPATRSRSGHPNPRTPAHASRARSRSRTPARLPLLLDDAAQPRLRAPGCRRGTSARRRSATSCGYSCCTRSHSTSAGDSPQLAVVAEHERRRRAGARSRRARWPRRRRGAAPRRPPRRRTCRWPSRSSRLRARSRPRGTATRRRRRRACRSSASLGIIDSPASGIRCAEYSTSSPPSTSGAIAGWAFSAAMIASGRVDLGRERRQLQHRHRRRACRGWCRRTRRR